MTHIAKTPLLGDWNVNNFVTATKVYFPLNPSSNYNNAADQVGNTTLIPIPGTMTRARLRADYTGISGAVDRKFDLVYWRGGSGPTATGITITVPAAGDLADHVTEHEDYTNTFDVQAGDRFAWCTYSADQATTSDDLDMLRIGVTFESDDNTKTVIAASGLGTTLSNTAAQYLPWCGCRVRDTDTNNMAQVVAADGYLSDFAVELSAAPGAGKSRAFRLYRLDPGGWTYTGLTVTVSDAATTATSASQVYVEAGYLYTWQCLPSGSPTSARAAISASFESDDPVGQALLSMGREGSPNLNGSERYESPTGSETGWASDDLTQGGLVTSHFSVLHLEGQVYTAPGAGSGELLGLYFSDVNRMSLQIDGTAKTGSLTQRRSVNRHSRILTRHAADAGQTIPIVSPAITYIGTALLAEEHPLLTDANEDSAGAVTLEPSDQSFGVAMDYGFGNPDRYAAFQFTLNVDPGQLIAEAYIGFSLLFSVKDDNFDVTIRAEQADDASTLTGATDELSDMFAAAAGAEEVVWYEMGAGYTEVYSPDITAILQEIVDRAGWAYGNSVTLIFEVGTDCEAYVGGVGYSATGPSATLDVIPSNVQTLTLAGFTDADAFGTMTLQQTLAMTGFTAADAFGVMALIQSLSVAGFVDGDTFGVMSLGQILNLAGFTDTPDTFGTFALIQTLDLAGFTDPDVFGVMSVIDVAQLVSLGPWLVGDIGRRWAAEGLSARWGVGDLVRRWQSREIGR